jgi:hypothetical protein
MAVVTWAQDNPWVVILLAAAVLIFCTPGLDFWFPR